MRAGLVFLAMRLLGWAVLSSASEKLGTRADLGYARAARAALRSLSGYALLCRGARNCRQWQDAGELVRHHHHGRTKGGPEVEDQLVEAERSHGIQTRRRLVEEQELWIERHRARERRAFLHPAAELRGLRSHRIR